MSELVDFIHFEAPFLIGPFVVMFYCGGIMAWFDETLAITEVVGIWLSLWGIAQVLSIVLYLIEYKI